MTPRNLRAAFVLAGVASLGAAAVSAEIAWLHMRWVAAAYGMICGAGAVGHCPACPAAVGLLAAGLALLAAAGRSGPLWAAPRQVVRAVSERI